MTVHVYCQKGYLLEARVAIRPYVSAYAKRRLEFGEAGHVVIRTRSSVVGGWVGSYIPLTASD